MPIKFSGGLITPVVKPPRVTVEPVVKTHTIFNVKKPIKQVIVSQFEKQPEDWFIEDRWVSERLFDVEDFKGHPTKHPYYLFDPFCGTGRILDAAKKRLYTAYGADIVDRKERDPEHGFTQTDTTIFYGKHWLYPVVSNPPYDKVDQIFDTMIKEGVHAKTAFFLPMAYLAGKAKRLCKLPLVRVWVCKPRPNCLPGELITSGVKPGGGKKDYAWFVFAGAGKNFQTAGVGPRVLWLEKDPNLQVSQVNQ